MVQLAMVAVVGFLLAMSVIFIAIELSSRFDRSFLIFGIANILLTFFCLIDIKIQPHSMIEGWTKLQHIIAAFFPAVLLWLVMTLIGKVHVQTLICLAIIGVLFSFSMIGDTMFNVHDEKMTGTIYYNLLYVPFMFGSIAGCMTFLCFHYVKSKGIIRANLRWYLIGSIVLSASGIFDMICIITGDRFFPQVPSRVVLGVLTFSLIMTIVFINRLSVIIINREQTFSKLREAYKELDHLRPIARAGQLTALFAHEVKNKSFSISLMLNSARRVALPPVVTMALDKCFSVASTISRSSSELLAQSETTAVHSMPFDIRACVSDAATAALTGCYETVVADLNLPEVVVRGDRLKLLSVFDILFTNSIQAGASHLRVRAVIGNGCIVITVEDDGKGCGQEAFDNLFKPFFTTKQDRFGTGLGLSIAQSVIQNHEGSISAYSKNIIGNGETGMIFCLTLPMHGAEPPAMSGEPEFLVIEEGLLHQLPGIYRILSHINVRYRTLQSGKDDTNAIPQGIKTICSSLIDPIPVITDPLFIDPEIPIPVIRRNDSNEVTIFTEAWILENFYRPYITHFHQERFSV